MSRKFAKYLQVLIIPIIALGYQGVSAQKGYAQDSLQIKVYTEISYERFQPIDIQVTKIFCDYCNNKQVEHLKVVAYDLAYAERNAPENIMKNGKKNWQYI